MGFHAQAKGSVPPDGPVTIGGMNLPPGAPLLSDFGQVEPLAWLTHEMPENHGVLQQAVRILAENFPNTGLWPVVFYSDPQSPSQPAVTGKFSVALDDFNADEFLLKAWWYRTLPEWETLTPEISSPFPQAADLYLPASYEGAQPQGLILAPGTSPADALETLGWQCVHDIELDGVPIARIIQSWERRFHLTLVGMGEKFMLFQPPVGGLEASALAALNAEAFRINPDDESPPHFLMIDEGKSIVSVEI